MSEPNSASRRVLEGIAITVIGTAATSLGALFLPPVLAWLRGTVTLPGWSIAAALILIVAVIIVLVRGQARLKSTPQAAAPPVAVKPEFVPSSMQVKCIAALRYLDQNWVELERMFDAIPTEARGDIRHALEDLVEHQWAANLLVGPAFRLEAPALEFAKANNFPVKERTLPRGRPPLGR